VTHDNKLTELRAVIEGMPANAAQAGFKHDVLHAISRLEGHLTAAEALEALVKFCEERAHMESINVQHRQAYEQAWQYGVNLRNRVRA